jgi:hypothetical protein
MHLEEIVTRFSLNKREKIVLCVIAAALIACIVMTYGCSKPAPTGPLPASIPDAATQQPLAEITQPVRSDRARTKNGHYFFVHFDLSAPGVDPIQAQLDAEAKFENQHPKLTVLSVSTYGDSLEIYTASCGC